MWEKRVKEVHMYLYGFDKYVNVGVGVHRCVKVGKCLCRCGCTCMCMCKKVCGG